MLAKAPPTLSNYACNCSCGLKTNLLMLFSRELIFISTWRKSIPAQRSLSFSGSGNNTRVGNLDLVNSHPTPTAFMGIDSLDNDLLTYKG